MKRTLATVRASLQTLWRWVLRVPNGVWGGLFAAITIFGLYLRGRRIEAELARAKLDQIVARAKLETAKSAARAEVHRVQMRDTERKIDEIEVARRLAGVSAEKDARRLRSLKPSEVHLEYMKLLMKRRGELGVEETLKESADLSKITIRPPRPSRKPEE